MTPASNLCHQSKPSMIHCGLHREVFALVCTTLFFRGSCLTPANAATADELIVAGRRRKAKYKYRIFYTSGEKRIGQLAQFKHLIFSHWERSRRARAMHTGHNRRALGKNIQKRRTFRGPCPHHPAARYGLPAARRSRKGASTSPHCVHSMVLSMGSGNAPRYHCRVPSASCTHRSTPGGPAISFT